MLALLLMGAASLILALLGGIAIGLRIRAADYGNGYLTGYQDRAQDERAEEGSTDASTAA